MSACPVRRMLSACAAARIHAYGSGGYGGLAANAFGKRHLVSGTSRNRRVGDQASRGTVNQVDTGSLQQLGEFDRLVEGPAALDPIGGGDADEERKALGPLVAHGCHDFVHEAHAVGETASVLVG